MTDKFSVDTADLRGAGRRLERKANEIDALRDRWVDLLNQAKDALGTDSAGKKMADALSDNSKVTSDAISAYAGAIRSGGKGFGSAADAFVATEEAATMAAKNLDTVSGPMSALDKVSSGNSPTSTSSSSSSSSTSTSSGKH